MRSLTILALLIWSTVAMGQTSTKFNYSNTVIYSETSADLNVDDNGLSAFNFVVAGFKVGGNVLSFGTAYTAAENSEDQPDFMLMYDWFPRKKPRWFKFLSTSTTIPFVEDELIYAETRAMMEWNFTGYKLGWEAAPYALGRDEWFYSTISESVQSLKLTKNVRPGVRQFLTYSFDDGKLNQAVIGPSVEFSVGPVNGFLFYGEDHITRDEVNQEMRLHFVAIL